MKCKTPAQDSRAALLSAARQVFAEKGYDGTTVKQLADKAGVNVSLVSYHFGGKEGLYKECILHVAEARIESMERLLQAPQNRDELKLRLRLFAEEMTEVHCRELGLCLIVHRDVDLGNPIAVDIFKNVFHRLFKSLVAFFAAAESRGVILPQKNPEILTSLVFGSLTSFLQSEKKREVLGLGSIQDPTFRANFITSWLELIWSGIGNDDFAPRTVLAPEQENAK